MTPLITFAWPETPIMIGAILLVALILRVLLNRAIRLGEAASLKASLGRTHGQSPRAEQILANATGLNSARHQARTRTIGSVLRSAVSVILVAITVLTVLDVLGVPLGPLLTSAGIGGVALAFGAQSLVKDYISGVFMIMEDQYGVGDLIDTGEVTGTVEEVGLRVTRLRDAGGQIWYVRNGEILRVGNQSQGWSTGTVDVPVAYDEDAARALAILDRVADEAFADERWKDVLLERPSVAGVNAVQGGTMTLRMFAKCAPNAHWGVQRDLLERAVAALRDAGVRGPVLPPYPGVTA